MSDVDTKALWALLDKATPGPWRCDDGYVFCGPMADARHDAVMARVTAWQKGDQSKPPVGVDPREHVATCPQENPDVAANEELIVALLNAAPAMLDEIEALRAKVKEMEARIETMKDDAQHHAWEMDERNDD